MNKRISVFVFDRESFTSICRLVLRVSAHLSQVSVIIVVPNFALFGCLTIVYGSLDHRLNQTHACHDTSYLD